MCVKEMATSVMLNLQAQSAVVRQAMKSPQASVRQCATRVFKLLGGDTLPDASAAPSQAAATPQPDLMGDLLGEEEPTPAAATDLGEDASIRLHVLHCVICIRRMVSCRIVYLD